MSVVQSFTVQNPDELTSRLDLNTDSEPEELTVKYLYSGCKVTTDTGETIIVSNTILHELYSEGVFTDTSKAVAT